MVTLPNRHGLKRITCWRFNKRKLFDISAESGGVYKILCLYHPAECITSLRESDLGTHVRNSSQHTAQVIILLKISFAYKKIWIPSRATASALSSGLRPLQLLVTCRLRFHVSSA